MGQGPDLVQGQPGAVLRVADPGAVLQTLLVPKGNTIRIDAKVRWLDDHAHTTDSEHDRVE